MPDARILEALKNNSMDVSRAHEELCAEMERKHAHSIHPHWSIDVLLPGSAWDTVETKKEKKKGEKNSQSGGHQVCFSSTMYILVPADSW